jgi:RNA polymerase sigma-70 factor (ECF subfamily)
MMGGWVEGPVTTTDEAAWVARARSGDAAAFEALLTRYERQIYAYIYRMMGGNPDDAQDLTQETFLKAYRALGRTSDDLNVSAWLHRIASNSCLDELRRRQRIRWQPWDMMKHDRLLRGKAGENPERSMIRQEAEGAVQTILNRMSARNKQALVLREYEGLSCEDIGEIMGISRSAVKSVLFRAREEFRKYSVELKFDAPLEDEEG